MQLVHSTSTKVLALTTETKKLAEIVVSIVCAHNLIFYVQNAYSFLDADTWCATCGNGFLGVQCPTCRFEGVHSTAGAGARSSSYKAAPAAGGGALNPKTQQQSAAADTADDSDDEVLARKRKNCEVAPAKSLGQVPSIPALLAVVQTLQQTKEREAEQPKSSKSSRK